MIRMTFALAIAVAATSAAAQTLELFAGERFGGERISLGSPSADLAELRFRDRTGSLTVSAGRWELCTDTQYRGTCVVFGAGRYDVLPGVLSRRIASARLVDVTASAASGVDAAGLTLYEHAGSGGRALSVVAAMPRLSDQGFNDIASSLDVRQGRWQLCVNADYGSPCAVFGPGRYALEGLWQDSISSLRPVYGANDQPLPAAGGVVLYQDAGWQGRSLMRTEATPSLRSYGFNDVASSIEVLAGRWELCTDADFGGQCTLFGPGRHTLEGALHDKVSSLRPR
jgi:hypothetical protein